MEVLKKIHPRGISTFRDGPGDRDARSDDRRVQALRAGALHADGAVGLRVARCCPSTCSARATSRNHPNANQPIGTGPFKFVEWQQGQFMRLDRNPDYWKQGRPYLDRIVARFIADGARAPRRSRKGEAHVGGFGADPCSRRQALAGAAAHRGDDQGLRDVSRRSSSSTSTRRRQPFDNLKVRQAIAYAIDRKFVIENIWFGFGKPATGPISSNFKRQRPLHRGRQQLQRSERRRDRQQAARRGRLSERRAAASASKSCTTSRHTARNGSASARYVQQQLAKLGIKATLRYEDVPTWLQARLHQLRLQLTPTGSRPGRSGDRRAPAVPLAS